MNEDIEEYYISYCLIDMGYSPTAINYMMKIHGKEFIQLLKKVDESIKEFRKHMLQNSISFYLAGQEY